MASFPRSFLALTLVLTLGSTALASERTTAWTSKQSLSHFDRADKTDFFALSNQFEAQINKLYCGPTSAVMVLNALRINNPAFQKPTEPKYYQGNTNTLPDGMNPVFERYTQDQFFNANTDAIKTKAQVFGETKKGAKPDYGLQLAQFTAMLETYDLKVKSVVVDDKVASKDVRKDIIENLRRAGDFVIVNYARAALDQKGGGHISPLGAYDAVSDSVLILDVNSSVQPWVWVKLNDLVAAMRTFDTVENRGYVLVSEKN